MKFTKMQGTGNDFVLVETKDTRRDWSPLAVAMCDRHFGIGGDGLLVILPSETHDFQMRVFNSDGSDGGISGNGLRCAVKYFVDEGKAKPGKKEISVETTTGIKTATVTKKAGKVVKVKAGMSEPRFEAEEIPVVVGQNRGMVKSMITHTVTLDGKELKLNLVSMGNPHAIYFYRGDVGKFPLASLGPKVEHHKIFPERVNFEVARLLGAGQIEARTWERGVGETLACGSGACAITVAARLHGYIKDKATIKEPGGALEVEWDGVGEVFLSGPAETVFTGEWPAD
ncbi:MAG: diaminopimelate epimerase [Dehalococcoidales bacterium]|nr:diaminopimelate epimerase [Dehalococcoidales bacterium]